MVNLNKSFLYGTIFASVTWTVSLYLYWQLTSKSLNNISSTYEPTAPKSDEISNDINNNNVLQPHANGYSNDIVDDFQKSKKFYNYKDNLKKYSSWNKFKNSKTLIDNLQPVVHKHSNEFENNELGMVNTLEEQKLKDEGYQTHAFNILVSNRLDNHRSIPDTRNALCKNQTFPKHLPSASIIICFYNEHLETLIRTIHSILDRTPTDILKEIILVDDFSALSNLHENLNTYINNVINKHDTVKLYKTKVREGLIRARMFGANKATGEVLVFLDSHIEVNEKWLEPLLKRIDENRTNVAMPVIDIINADTFQYTASPLVRGGFNWGLHFKWENLPKGTLVKPEDFIKPIKSPTMAGGLFAMNRQYFKELGEYDPGMNIWGGENLEISFRIWMCGGKLEMIPCSRVGHVFRRRRPYTAPNGEDTMLRNSLRVAHVWMDDYKEHFLKQGSFNASAVKYGDISYRQRLREDLKCHDFSWYLQNIYPELILPTDSNERLKNKWAALGQNKFEPWHSRKRNYTAQYQIRLADSNLCVQSAKDIKTKGGLLVLGNCLRVKTQAWYETDRHEFVLSKLLCMEANKPSVRLGKCHEMSGNQEWKHKGEAHTPIYNLAAGTCLSVSAKEIDAPVTLELCSNTDVLNQWQLVRDGYN